MNIDSRNQLLKSKILSNKSFGKRLGRLLKECPTVVITGASSGIGQSFSELFMTVAENILICNLSRSKSSIFSDGVNFADIECDVSDLPSIDSAVGKVMELRAERNLKGGILVVNNAGFGGYGMFPEPSLEHNCGMIDVNVRGLTYVCGKFIPIIKQTGGGFINVASTASWQPCPFLGVYAATKAYVMSFSLSLDWELRKFGSKCLCLCPGPTTTNFFRRAGFETRPLKRDFGHEAVEVAASAISAYSKGKNLKVVGLLNNVLTFVNYFMPRFLMCKISGPILERVRGNPRRK
ncbi:MAG: SDR family NAD(P)-dependent oxidoreductase [Opitutales bacterium]|nr:SDR family NAD(P)-dependent oxidoreductase [Opitutales bacterium]